MACEYGVGAGRDVRCDGVGLGAGIIGRLPAFFDEFNQVFVLSRGQGEGSDHDVRGDDGRYYMG
jgi:hypothetical protein